MNMFSPRSARLIAACVLTAPLLAFASAAGAAPLILDAAKSRLSFSGVQTGTKFRGKFSRYAAAINFDPDHVGVDLDIVATRAN